MWNMPSPEMPGRIADRALLRTRTTLATRKRNLLFRRKYKGDGGVKQYKRYASRNARSTAGHGVPRRATGGLCRSAKTNQPIRVVGNPECVVPPSGRLVTGVGL